MTAIILPTGANQFGFSSRGERSGSPAFTIGGATLSLAGFERLTISAVIPPADVMAV
jgi:hypothetical protein